MASPLCLQVYAEGGQYVAAVRYAEDAAVVVANYQNGTVKMAGRIVWREGRETFHAGESYDTAARIMYDRFDAHQRERMAKVIDAPPPPEAQ